MELVTIQEGSTSIQVPVQDQNYSFPPSSAAVFYNPRMALNRDIAVLMALHLKPGSYLDAMGATGIRGFRVAQEAGIPVIINDRDQIAAGLIRDNAEKFSLPVEVTVRDANALMSERRFDLVDLDPFGTPAPFVDAASKSSRKFLCITATDTAPLCGAHLKAGIRRYGAQPMNTEYHSEVGLRILLGFVAREVVKYDMGIEPLFCFAHEHFVRLQLKLSHSAASADRTLEKIGFIHQCTSCPYRSYENGLLPSSLVCPECGTRLHPIGPVWVDCVQNREVLVSLENLIPETGLSLPKQAERLLSLCRDEEDMPFSYDYHRLAKRNRVSPSSMEKVLDDLKRKGYTASRVHYSGYCLKTDAPVSEIEESITAQ